MNILNKTSDTYTLKNKHLSYSQVLAASLGLMGISGSVVIIIPLVFSSAGNGAWLAFAIAMLAYIFVAFQTNVFASRIATVGSLYVYVQQSLGQLTGTVVGWSLFIGYWAFIPVNSVAVPYYLLLSFYDLSGITPNTPSTLEVATLACGITGLACWLTIRGIKLSTHVILFIECITIAFIFLIVGAYFLNNGIHYDTAQFELKEVKFGTFSLGLILAMACFTGFEASSVLGVEAKLPLKMIPRANMTTIIIAGSAIMISAYALIQAFHGLTPALDKDEAPMTTLANSLNLGVVSPFILAGVAFSWFGCLLGCFNTGGRLLYSLSRQGKFHQTASRTHNKYNTPYIAIGLIAGTGLSIALILLFNGISVMDIITYLASFAAFGFLVSYIIVSIAAVAYIHKRGERPTLLQFISAIIAVGLMTLALSGSFYPAPQWPMNILPLLFLSVLALGVGYFLYLKKTQPDNILSSQVLIDNE